MPRRLAIAVIALPLLAAAPGLSLGQGAAAPPAAAVPGIIVTPGQPPRSETPAARERGGDQPAPGKDANENGEAPQQGGGCRYQERKLDLIV